jgi:hypothetical protein
MNKKKVDLNNPDEKKAEWVEPRLPKEKIVELTRGIFKGEIFTSWQLKDKSMLMMVFM